MQASYCVSFSRSANSTSTRVTATRTTCCHKTADPLCGAVPEQTEHRHGEAIEGAEVSLCFPDKFLNPLILLQFCMVYKVPTILHVSCIVRNAYLLMQETIVAEKSQKAWLSAAKRVLSAHYLT